MIAKLPITGGAYNNVDEVGLTSQSPILMDGYVDELGNTHKRPGTAPFCDLGTGAPVDGIYWWSKPKMVLAVSGGRVFKITDQDGTVVELPGARLRVGVRPIFATDGAYCYMANGNSIIRTSYDKTRVDILPSPNAPNSVDHVAWMDRYLLCFAQGSANFYWSEVNEPTNFTGEYNEIEGDPDPLVALHVGWREVMLFGEKSLEIYYNDGESPFRRLEGAFIQCGCSAKYSIIQADNSWFWLNDERNVVKLSGRSPQVISTPFDRAIQGFSRVDDCLGDHVRAGGYTFCVFQFPTEQRTLVYNYSLQQWSEWGLWDLNQARYFHFRGNCHCLAADWNLHLTGDRTTGKIYRMSPTIYNEGV